MKTKKQLLLEQNIKVIPQNRPTIIKFISFRNCWLLYEHSIATNVNSIIFTMFKKHLAKDEDHVHQQIQIQKAAHVPT